MWEVEMNVRLRAKILFVIFCVCIIPVSAYAANQANTVATPLPIEGVVRDGDIVSHDPERGVYRPTQQFADERMFGVVVDDPVLLLAPGEEEEYAGNTRPVVTYGEAFVNVSDLAGEVQVGDLVTSSRVVGVAQRFDRAYSGEILGFVLEPVVYDDQSFTVSVDDQSVRVGRALIALRLGYYDAERDRNKQVDELLRQIGTSTILSGALEQTGTGFDMFRLIRYLLGSAVAITAVILAMRRFGDLFAQSVISVGRNPLARSQIRSILVWNAVLIVVVSGVGLGIGVAIIAL